MRNSRSVVSLIGRSEEETRLLDGQGMKPIMAKATAVWLVDNTTLTFEQIAKFCGLHLLEVEGIANGDVAIGIMGIDPVSGNQLDRDEISKGEADPNYELSLKVLPSLAETKKRPGPKYTPIAKRQDKPTAILWLLKNHPELSDKQIIKLIGTTKTTINAIRNRTHWNISNIHPTDPVALGLCKQISLDEAVAAARQEKENQPQGPDPAQGQKILPSSESLKADDMGKKVVI